MDQKINTIDTEKAWQIVERFREICREHDLWLSVKTEEKPELKMIKIEEISIKVEV